MPNEPDFDRLRDEMVERQIEARGITAPNVLAALRAVPREEFVPAALRARAYEDCALEIAGGQTISQPYIVAYMIAALQLAGGERVLEIGTGSGYAAAVLARIAGRVFTIERLAELARAAAERLRAAGCTHVEVRHGDGTLGWPEAAPFDAIVVTAGGPAVPEQLCEQLALGGRLVIPIGPAYHQKLVRVTREGTERFRREDLIGVRFVPLVGQGGWRDPDSMYR
jgi:protein-L-isoaspartate(D-aspartate) O-methyltransferase